MVKNLLAHAGDIRDVSRFVPWIRKILWSRMATHSSTLAWRIPMYRGALQATVYGVTKSQTQLK